jgi:hypothetical protein
VEKPVIDQLVCALAALGAGVGFGVAYDLFKALRLKIGRAFFTALCDFLVCVLALCLLFLLFMSIGGGEARIYIALCAFLGAVIYFLTASAALLDFFTGILEITAEFLHIAARPIKKAAAVIKFLAKKAKLCFQKACKWFTIIVQGEVAATAVSPQDKKLAGSRPAAAAHSDEKEHENEAQTRRHNNQNRHSRAGGIRGNNAGFAETADGNRTGKTQ